MAAVEWWFETVRSEERSFLVVFAGPAEGLERAIKSRPRYLPLRAR